MTAATGGDEVSRALARWVVGVGAGDIPAAVRRQAQRAIVNFFATALGGCRDPAVEACLAVLAPFAAPGEAGVIGRRERLDALTAAFVNAASGNVFDFDDTHVPTVIHPTAPVLPALLALASRRRIGGAALIEAFVTGVEVECRIGNAVSPGHYRRGWHITATCGVFGAAAAAGRIIGLDAERLVWALGIASAQASGLVETLGTMAKSIGVGNAARNGLLAALLAERGVTGPARPLEGPRGFMAVTGEGGDPGRLTRGLGDGFELMRNTFKPWPCGVVLNPVIDAVFDLRARHRLQPGDIAAVTVTGHPLLGERADRPAPASGREAQVSAQHSVAVVLSRGAAGIPEFADAAVADPAVRALRDRVRVGADAAMAAGAARVVIRCRDGRVCETTVTRARGSLEHPLSDAELDAKLVSLAAHGCPALDPGPLVNALKSLEDLDDAGSLLGLAAAPG